MGCCLWRQPITLTVIPYVMKTKFMNCLAAGCVMLVMAGISACSKKGSSPAPSGGTDTTTVKPVSYNYTVLADSMQSKTYTTFISANGNYFIQNNAGNITFNYWPQAHMLDVLTDAYLRTKNSVYTQRMKAVLTGVKATNGGAYPNDYYDDMGWMANAFLRAYTVTNDAEYLNATQILYTDIKTGFNNNEGGGIAWRKEQLNYKNIPATATAAILASRLYELQSNTADLTLAKSLYSWMKATLVDPSTGVVWDGINSNGSGAVDKNVYTYNQGLFVGAAVELYKITKDPTYLADAVHTATNAIADPHITASGLFKSEGQGDGGLFKGIMVRYLTLLIEQPDLDGGSRAKYLTFLQTNAQYLYTVGVAKPSYMAGPDWTQKPTGSTDLTTQLSAVMMMEAAATLKAEGKIQ